MKFKAKVIFLVGPPLSGKDTQGKLLAKKLKGKFFATSALIREFFEKTKKNYLKIGNKNLDLKKEKEKLKTGDLVDSLLVTQIVLDRIKENLNKKNLIIAGSPRRFFEAKREFYFLKENLPQGFIFILLDVSQKEIFKRALKRKREDDALEIVKKRIENYKKETLPAINFLNEKGVLIKVKGEGRVLKIHREIIEKLRKRGFEL